MKTALGIGLKHGLPMHDPIQKYHIINAMKEYASQAVDRCAESASLIRPKEAPDYLDKQSILNVKNELK